MKYVYFFLLAIIVLTGSADAAGIVEWQLGFQEAVTPTMKKLAGFHDLLLIVITAITVIVLGLLLYIIIRFNEKANPVPSKTSHNTVLEIVWTAVPIVVLLIICIPSFRILYEVDGPQDPDMTLKVTGYQWYWGYEYPDQGNISFEAVLKKKLPEDPKLRAVALKEDPESYLKKGEPYLLATDNQVVLPVDTTIRVLVTGADVIHAWAVPAFGIKIDAVPGRINETWMRIEKEGVYYGQCSELCGKDHGFMPIAIRAVSKEEYAAWVIKQGGSIQAANAEIEIEVEALTKAALVDNARGGYAMAAALIEEVDVASSESAVAAASVSSEQLIKAINIAEKEKRFSKTQKESIPIIQE